MSKYMYERLSAQDNTFLLWERPTVHMHVAATAIYDASTVSNKDGGVDIGAFKRSVESVLHLIPRYRQKLKWIPYENHPVWVDDRHFNLDYHIRHTSLPRPGTLAQLQQLAARIMGQQLDRSKPLWEHWVIEGLEGNRFAVVSKVHHCMIDGAAGADLATVLMSLDPNWDPPAPQAYIPRPAPSATELVRDEWIRRLSFPFAIARGIRNFNHETEDIRHEIWKRVQAVSELVGYAIKGASETPLNGTLSPHRQLDWMEMDLEEIKSVRRALGCTVNDIVLATVAGGVRSYMLRRRVNPDKLDYRVSAPVSVRRDNEKHDLGNRVSSWIVRLPVDRPDPIKRLDAIHRITQRLKKSEQALAVEMLMAAADWAPSQLLSLGSQATSGPINMIVTNVPGPQVPLYMTGAKLLQMFPQVPLLENTGLGVALFSYDGKLFWGFNADPSLVPDLPYFVKAIRKSFDELKEATAIRPANTKRESAKEDSSSQAKAPSGKGTSAAGNPGKKASPSAAKRRVDRSAS